MSDGELIQSWSPGGPSYVLVLQFQDPEDMFLAQERLTQQLCGWTDQGDRFDRMETVFMAYGQTGCRTLLDGQVETVLAVSPAGEVASAKRLRQAWAEERMMAVAPGLANLRLSEAWAPSVEQQDWFDKWSEEVVEPHPGGPEASKRHKTGWVRGGFNQYVYDHGRPDLRFLGSGGGRAFSALMQARFKAELEVRYQGNNAFYHGIQQREAARKDWFVNPNSP